jgi:predicted RNA binding protein YcfA (HicA-like mRNA interferase family)
MTKLPVIKPRECIKALESIGFRVDRQHGSHIIMRRDDPYAQVIVPNHPEIHRGTLRTIIRDAGLTVDEFVNLLG